MILGTYVHGVRYKRRKPAASCEELFWEDSLGLSTRDCRVGHVLFSDISDLGQLELPAFPSNDTGYRFPRGRRCVQLHTSDQKGALNEVQKVGRRCLSGPWESAHLVLHRNPRDIGPPHPSETTTSYA